MDNGGMTDRDDAFFQDLRQKEFIRVTKLLANAILELYNPYSEAIITNETFEAINLAKQLVRN